MAAPYQGEFGVTRSGWRSKEKVELFKLVASGGALGEVANTLEEALHRKLRGLGTVIPVFGQQGNNKLGLHVAIIWHNTLRHFSFFFSFF